MPLELKRVLNDWFKVGVAYGLLATALSMLVGWLKVPLVNITFSAFDINVRQQIAAGTSTNLGQGLLGLLSGLTGFTLPGFITVLVSGILIVYIGALLYHWQNFYRAKTPVGRLTTILFTGSIVGGFIAALAFSLPTFGTLAAMLIHSALIALIIWLLSMKLGVLKIPE